MLVYCADTFRNIFLEELQFLSIYLSQMSDGNAFKAFRLHSAMNNAWTIRKERESEKNEVKHQQPTKQTNNRRFSFYDLLFLLVAKHEQSTSGTPLKAKTHTHTLIHKHYTLFCKEYVVHFLQNRLQFQCKEKYVLVLHFVLARNSAWYINMVLAFFRLAFARTFASNQ